MSSSNLHVVVGLGVTGLSCVHYLKLQGIPCAVTDTRESLPQLEAFRLTNPDVPVYLGKLDPSVLAKASVIVLSPGVSLREPAIAEQIERGTPVIGDIELFAKAVKAPVIAITGTNAKSTVTTLVGKMAEAAGLRVQAGGNLGEPALEMLLKHPHTELFVLELSSFQLETTYSLQPKVATVLNISPDHMDRYETLVDYQMAKHRIYQHCETAVCYRDDPLTDVKTTVSKKIYFTLGEPGEEEFGITRDETGAYLAFGNQKLIATTELPVIGGHYHANALASLAIGYGYGLPFEPMLRVLRDFKGLPHRCQFVREYHRVRWYNDSKGTNVGATQAAIEGLGREINGKLILIAGGIGKNADFRVLTPVIEQYSRHVVLIGRDANDMARAIDGKVDVTFAKSMDEAVALAATLALPGDAVLLSPACASFDMFKHFEHRGDVFMEIVERL